MVQIVIATPNGNLKKSLRRTAKVANIINMAKNEKKLKAKGKYELAFQKKGKYIVMDNDKLLSSYISDINPGSKLFVLEK